MLLGSAEQLGTILGYSIGTAPTQHSFPLQTTVSSLL